MSNRDVHGEMQYGESNNSAILLLSPPSTACSPPPRQVSPVKDGSLPAFDGPTITLPSGDKTTIICEPKISGDDDHGSISKCTPVICEQGPSTPSSPTSPGSSRLRRPRPLTADAMERISLLATSCSTGIDFNKLSPLSPYGTSDLGSSSRSSINLATSIVNPCWTGFRDSKKLSLEGDGDSDICSKDLLSPCIYSPAPFSPFSDCTESPETPLSAYGAISPALSPLISMQSLHFTFDPVRSSSSLSGHADSVHHLLVPGSSMDLHTRERSRSDGEMASKGNSEKMDTSVVQSTISIPATPCCLSAASGQYKKRLLRKYEKEQEDKKIHKCDPEECAFSSVIAPSADISEEKAGKSKKSVEHSNKQPVISDYYSSTSTNLQPKQPVLLSNEPFGNQQQFNAWMQHQLFTWRNHWYRSPESFPRIRNPAVIGVQTTSPCMLVQPGDHMSRGMVRNTISPETESNFGPIRTATVWRRSRSESDVTLGNYICQHCGQAFALYDRLAKHIASRHRDRSVSVAVEDCPSKAHKCTACNKSFGRSDMLTRHMRLHTGIKPYGCQICGQIFSRSDHLSTHQRTHTGEKPYQCPQCSYAASRRDMITRHMRTHVRPSASPEFNPLAISQLSLSQSSIQLQQTEMGLADNIDLRSPSFSSAGFSSGQPHPLVRSPLLMCAAAALVVTTDADDRLSSSRNDLLLPQNLPISPAASSLISSHLPSTVFTALDKFSISQSAMVTSSSQKLPLSSGSNLLTLPNSISLQSLCSSSSVTSALCMQAGIGDFSFVKPN